MTAQWPSDWVAIDDRHPYLIAPSGIEDADQYDPDAYLHIPWHDETEKGLGDAKPDIDGLLLRLNTWQQMRDALEEIRNTIDRTVSGVEKPSMTDWLALISKADAVLLAARGEGVGDE